MDKYLNKVLIIDGSYMMHRALHTPAMQELTTSSGVKSGGVFGFLRIFQSEIKKFSGYFPVVCWDKGLSKRRTDIYPDYKANRQRQQADSMISIAGETPEVDDYLEEYHRQRSDVIQILKTLGVPSLIIPGWEGDDLQYLVSRVSEDSIVVTDDKDLIQLVSPTCKIRRAMRDETISWEESDSYYHHPHFTIVKSICGDPSDNIPSVAKGLGWKGADVIASIIDECSFDQYKTVLEEYVSNNKGSVVTKINKLLENWDQFVINYNLIDLRLVEVPEGFEPMIRDLIQGVVGKSNLLKAYTLIGKYEMTTIYPDQIVFLISASSSQVLKKEG